MNDAPEQPQRWLRVTHSTRYEHNPPVDVGHHVACLSPRSTAYQQVRAWQLRIDPLPDRWREPVDLSQYLHLDAWGNGRLVFGHSRVHAGLEVLSQFEAGLSARPTPDPLASPPWEAVAHALRYHQGDVHTEAVEFSLASPYAAPDSALAAFAAQAFTPGRPLADGALAFMARIHAGFRYEPAATQVSTRAAEALRLRRGVCQDFAQVLIAGCRALGLAARYVSGYLLTHPAPGKPRLIGADASHAWAEVWCPQQGWLALDPTNNVMPGLDHVSLAWGRDYADVAPLRGVIRGGGMALPAVAVTVEPL